MYKSTNNKGSSSVSPGWIMASDPPILYSVWLFKYLGNLQFSSCHLKSNNKKEMPKQKSQHQQLKSITKA